jgi:hypothetical protein
MERCGLVRQVRLGERGMEPSGEVRLDMVWQVRLGKVWLGENWLGKIRIGMAGLVGCERYVLVRNAGYGLATLIRSARMSDKWHGGKGSKRRPEDRKAYEDNYDKIFGKKDGQSDKPPESERVSQTPTGNESEC